MRTGKNLQGGAEVTTPCTKQVKNQELFNISARERDKHTRGSNERGENGDTTPCPTGPPHRPSNPKEGTEGRREMEEAAKLKRGRQLEQERAKRRNKDHASMQQPQH
mmetsp:Transcript_2830/g.5869  ORF Transcript_2830/g.5869 Transcript_2830/m.5869 type:complete len:107 (-) Transcript_2830:167-487(-)